MTPNSEGAGARRRNDAAHSQRELARKHKDKIREVEHILEELGDWQGADPKTGFQLVRTKGETPEDRRSGG